MGGPDCREGGDFLLHAVPVEHQAGIQPSHAVGDDVNPGPSGEIFSQPQDFFPEVCSAPLKGVRPGHPGMKSLKSVGDEGAAYLAEIVVGIVRLIVFGSKGRDDPVKGGDAVGQNDG